MLEAEKPEDLPEPTNKDVILDTMEILKMDYILSLPVV